MLSRRSHPLILKPSPAVRRSLLLIVLVAQAVQPARALVVSDQPAAVVSYPYVFVDTAGGADTFLELSNTSASAVSVRCFYENATSRCDGSGPPCSTDADCVPPAVCPPVWGALSFSIQLTSRQPIGWWASAGLASLPLPANEGSVPPVPEDPFVGGLRCVEVDAAGVPVGGNSLVGHATLERFDSADTARLDVAKYNAIGMEAVAGAGDGDGTLVLGGGSAEYNGCPDTTIVNHLFEGATEPVSHASDLETLLVLMSCSVDYGTKTVAQPIVQYLVFNEFEQRFSGTLVVPGHVAATLSNINPVIFDVATSGTLTGNTRLRAIDSGILALVVERHRDLADPTHVRSGARNVYQEGERSEPDLIFLFSPTRTPTFTSTPTPTPTATITPTPTGSPVAVDLQRAVGRPGGVACVSAALNANGMAVASTSNEIGFDPGLFGVNACTINPAIGPGTATDKQVVTSSIGPWLERVTVTGANANTNTIPDGPLYACELGIDAAGVPGSYPLSNTAAASDPGGNSLPATGAAGEIVVTECVGDCDGNGLLTIGEVIRCVNLFLGRPLCNAGSPALSCPVADANGDGTVSIGEVIQCVNRFLGGCG